MDLQKIADMNRPLPEHYEMETDLGITYRILDYIKDSQEYIDYILSLLTPKPKTELPDVNERTEYFAITTISKKLIVVTFIPETKSWMRPVWLPPLANFKYFDITELLALISKK